MFGSKPGEQPKPQQIQVELPKEVSEGIYSNLALIAHSPSEFILDFARVLPGAPKAKVFSRIVMTPQHAQLLKKALEENIKKFESNFGEIKMTGLPDKEIGFKTPSEQT
ncbi:MAG: DUF3467 domain-containing protein [bacterium]